MKACWCSLAGTRACLTCPNSDIGWNSPKEHLDCIPYKIKLVIEKFDKDGKLVERITEE